MKLRVKQIGRTFYPQYRELFVWRSFKHADDKSTASFTFLEDAIEAIKYYMKARQDRARDEARDKKNTKIVWRN